MPASPTFPAFTKLEHQPNPSAKSSLLAEILTTTTSAEESFRKSFKEIGSIVSGVYAEIKGNGAKLDIGLPGLRQNAADATFAAERLRTMASAAQSLADKVRAMGPAFGDVTAETTRYAQALSAQAVEAENAKRVANGQVATYQNLQHELDQTISKNQALAQSYRETFLEQAKATNTAHRFQQNTNAIYGIGAPVKSAAASASVFMNCLLYTSDAADE